MPQPQQFHITARSLMAIRKAQHCETLCPPAACLSACRHGRHVAWACLQCSAYLVCWAEVYGHASTNANLPLMGPAHADGANCAAAKVVQAHVCILKLHDWDCKCMASNLSPLWLQAGQALQ